MVEFALVAPLLLMLLFGAIEYGIAFNRAQAVEAAAREGARLASISSTTVADVQTRVDDTLAGIPMSTPVVGVAPSTCAGRPGEEVQVTVAVDHVITIPLVNTWTVNLTGQAVFRCEA